MIVLRAAPAGLLVAIGLAVAAPAAAADGLAGNYLAARQASLESDYTAAAKYYDRALTVAPDTARLLEGAALAYTGLGEVAKAVPLAKRMQELGLDGQIGRMVLLAGRLKEGDYDAALAQLSEGRQVGPLVDGLLAAWAKFGEGDPAAARDAFDRAAEDSRLPSFVVYHKALALAAAGDFEAAGKVFAGETGPEPRMTRRGVRAYAQVLSQLGRDDEAIALIDRAMGSDPPPSIAELRERLAAGDRVPFDLIRDPQDGFAEVFYSVAGVLQGQATDGYTLLYTRLAGFLRPGHVDALLLSAQLLEAQERYALATEAYGEVPRGHPNFYAAELGRAETLRRTGKAEAGIEVLSQLAGRFPDLPVVEANLGDALRVDEQYAAASKAYSAAIADYATPEEAGWRLFYRRGITREREKRWPKAEADFREALELEPDQPQVLNYLGYSLVERREKLDEALDMIERAVKGRPDDGYITDSLGWVLYRLGRYREAVPKMERAVELTPVDPVLNDHLGDVYWAVGRKREAEFQWKRALSFDPEADRAERIRRKLEVGLDEVRAEEGDEPLSVAADDG